MFRIIPIITSAPIQYSFNQLDMYDAFDLVSQGKLEAPLTENALDIINNHVFNFSLKSIKTIFTAEKGQTVETARLIVNSGLAPNAKIISTRMLNGITFCMGDLITKEEFIKMSQDYALTFARRKFLERLYENKFNESLSDLISRMEDLFFLLKSTNEPVLCISHSFYIKLIEIYSKDKISLSKVENLIQAFNPNYRPYEALSGFDIIL